MIYLRDLLATRAALEPDVTAFLSCWVYEELWHGEALSRFLGEAGHRLPPDHGDHPRADAPYPSRAARNSWIRRKLGGSGYAPHLVTMLGSLVVRDFVALHMTWGAVNELSTLTGYQRLIQTTRHPVLVDLLSRIIKDERRHFAFYRSQARLRLARSPQARRITRWALEKLWAPVGTGVRPQQETDFLIAHLFADEAGADAARTMDETISELPGLAGMRIVGRARLQALDRSNQNGSKIARIAARRETRGVDRVEANGKDGWCPHGARARGRGLRRKQEDGG
ncbi:MAG: ferritin-like domain-containing protein [Actinomycetota bacterium]